MINFHPQSYAKTIYDNSCLAFCYIFCGYGGECTNQQYYNILLECQKRGYLDDDFTVLDADKMLTYLRGKNTKVIKKDIVTIKDITLLTPVRYSADANKKTGHWVVVEEGNIVFNPLEYSVNVAYGIPVEARVIKW